MNMDHRTVSIFTEARGCAARERLLVYTWQGAGRFEWQKEQEEAKL